MYPSFYLKVFADNCPDHRLLFSMKTGAIVRVHRFLAESLQNQTVPARHADLLARLGMAVSDPEAEKKEMLGFFDRLNARDPELHFTVVLNLDCNFACSYCYEGSSKGKHYMTTDNADHLLDFIQARFKRGKKRLRIDFYGGEPLLSMDLIRRIASAAGEIAQSRNAECRLNLVTNGSLLKPEIAEDLARHGVKNARITIDGPAETHNQSRPFKSGKNSFDAILSNIKASCGIIKIAIGGNFEKHNYLKFPLLLDHLVNLGLTPEKIGPVKFDPVMKAPAGGLSIPEYHGGCASLNESWIREAEAFLREEILKRGYATQKIRPVTCMVDIQDSWVVHYTGEIYKCPAFIGKPEFAAGDLVAGIHDYSGMYHTQHWQNEHCAQCPYLPLCFGGCRYMAYVRDGRVEATDCRKDYLDACLERLVQQDARYKLTGRRN